MSFSRYDSSPYMMRQNGTILNVLKYFKFIPVNSLLVIISTTQLSFCTHSTTTWLAKLILLINRGNHHSWAHKQNWKWKTSSQTTRVLLESHKININVDKYIGSHIQLSQERLFPRLAQMYSRGPWSCDARTAALTAAFYTMVSPGEMKCMELRNSSAICEARKNDREFSIIDVIE